MGCMNKDMEYFYREIRAHHQQQFIVREVNQENIITRENSRKRNNDEARIGKKRKENYELDSNLWSEKKKLRIDPSDGSIITEELYERELLNFTKNLKLAIAKRRKNDQIIHTLHQEME